MAIDEIRFDNSQFNVVNPYNFVPLGSTPARARYQAGQRGKLTGYLDLNLVNTTPVIIPDASRKEPDGQIRDHYYYPFFKVDGKPIIPGSELRGLIRSVYETLTNSCLPLTPDKANLVQRIPDIAAFKLHGILRCEPGADGEMIWTLYKANGSYLKIDRAAIPSDRPVGVRGGRYHIRGTTFKDGQRVWYTKNDHGEITNIYESKPATSDTTTCGILQVNYPVIGGSLKHYKVWVLDAARERIAEGNDLYDALYAELSESVENAIGDKVTESSFTGEKWNTLISKAERKVSNLAPFDLCHTLVQAKKEGGDIPVWYRRIGNAQNSTVFISPAAIGRVYLRTNWDKVFGEWAACSSRESLCPACSLFGTVTDGKGVRGRVRVTDAIPNCDITDGDFGKRILGILGTPKPTSYDFYLKKPNTVRNTAYWNYSFYYNPFATNEDRTLGDYLLYDAHIRGRKYYWHHKPADCNAEKSRLNATMEYLRPDKSFCFRLYFDGISEDELSVLKYALTLGENMQSGVYQHAIGHGKPFGYGSIKISIRNTVIRKLALEDGHIGYELSKSPKEEELIIPMPSGINESIADDLLCISRTDIDWASMGVDVTYPKKDGEIFKWFANNHNSKFGGIPLPTISEIGTKISPIEAMAPDNQAETPVVTYPDPLKYFPNTKAKVRTRISNEPAKKQVLYMLDKGVQGLLEGAAKVTRDPKEVKIIRWDEVRNAYIVKLL